MERDAGDTHGGVEECGVDGAVNARQLYGIAAIVGVDVRFVDGEVEEGAARNAAVLAFLSLRHGHG